MVRFFISYFGYYLNANENVSLDCVMIGNTAVGVYSYYNKHTNSRNITYYFGNEHLWLPKLALNKLKINKRFSNY